MLPTLLSVAFYVAFCALVGRIGRNRNVGFAGFFLLSLLLTPVITGLLLLITAERRGEA
jgi:ABC-type molybdate transport system permease subunit